MAFASEYSKLPDLEEFDNTSKFPSSTKKQHRISDSSRHLPASYVVCGIVIATTLCILSFIVGKYVGNRSSARECWNKHAALTPVVSNIDLSYHDVVFNGTIDFPSKYRGEPSPSVDAAWDEYESFSMISLTYEDLNLVPAEFSRARFNPEIGGYMGGVEVVHQLHCLNFLRKSLYHNYDYYKTRSAEFHDPENITQTHLGHCVEMLRQNLMCNADTGMIGYRWVEGYSHPYPDFNTKHRCRSFDSIIDWAKERAATVPKHSGHHFEGLERQPGDKLWSSPP